MPVTQRSLLYPEPLIDVPPIINSGNNVINKLYNKAYPTHKK